MKKDEKQKQVEALHQELEKARSVLLSGFQGLTVAQDSILRRRIAAAGASHHVVKNTLIERAAKGTPTEPAIQSLRGTTVVTSTDKDPVELAKIITAYAKENPVLLFKTGVVEGRVISMADLVALATLPPKETLYSKVLFLVNSPATRVASTLSAVARNLAYVIKQGVEERKFKETAA